MRINWFSLYSFIVKLPTLSCRRFIRYKPNQYFIGSGNDYRRDVRTAEFSNEVFRNGSLSVNKVNEVYVGLCVHLIKSKLDSFAVWNGDDPFAWTIIGIVVCSTSIFNTSWLKIQVTRFTAVKPGWINSFSMVVDFEYIFFSELGALHIYAQW